MSEIKIKDGTGTGNAAKVDVNNRLHTFSVTETEAEFINSNDNDAFLLYLDITPTGANDVFAYIKNTNQTKNMVLNWYRLWTESVAEAVDVYAGRTGTPAGTTTLTPSNLTVTSSIAATGDFFEGVDITGLSGGSLLDRLRISGDGKDVVDDFPGKIIVPTGGVISFQALNGAIPIELTVSFHYREV